MTGRKPHRARAAPRWKERLAKASTPDERLDVAYGRLTAALAHMRRPRRPDPLLQAADAAAAATMADQAADYLMMIAAHIEGGSP